MNLQKEKGITLVALVVTIVVLLILAGVSINLVLGENGLITQAKEAKTRTSAEEEKEQQTLKDASETIEDVTSEVAEVKDSEPGKLEESNGKYIINSIEDLVVFASETANGNVYEGKEVILGTDLDFKSTKSYVNATRTDYAQYGYNGELKKLINQSGFIGIKDFKGTFDGNNHFIKNLYITKEVTEYSYWGLFRENHGTIKNLKVDKCNIQVSGNNSYGFFGGICGNNEGFINNCNVTGELNSNYERTIFGGIAGRSTQELTNCINYANISGMSTQCGGVVGQYASGKLEQCGDYGNINLTSTSYIGGIVGLSGLPDSGGTDVKECFSKGNIKINSNKPLKAGGIVGQKNAGRIIDCYSEGNIDITSTSEGIQVGGIAGLASMVWIYGVYTVGNINVDAPNGLVCGITSVSEQRILNGAYYEGTITTREDNQVGAISSYDSEKCYEIKNVFYFSNIKNAFNDEYTKEDEAKLEQKISSDKLYEILENSSNGTAWKKTNEYPKLEWE